MKRSKFSLSHYKLLSMNMGELVPIACYEVLPGDSIQQSTSALVRFSPLQAPLMHPVVVKIHHWFVPHRIVWDDWEDFITGGPTGEFSGTYPVVTSPPSVGWTKYSLPDYMGVPPEVPDIEHSLLPIYSYNKIWNEFYRDQDLQAEAVINNLDVLKVSWEKDYFTSARPWPQKGPDVTIPLGTQAPITGIGQLANNTYDLTGGSVYDPALGLTTYDDYRVIKDVAGSQFAVKGPASGVGNPQIFADLSQATSATVLELREAMAIQRYQEARARYGSRYTEYLRYLGVRSSDARLQRPEYLGGGKSTIAFSEVLQTTPSLDGGTSEQFGVGTMWGHGVGALRSRRWRRFFEEHGIVLSLMSIRPKAMYANGLNKMWNRRTKEDYWQRELQHIGLQEIATKEVYAPGGNTVFGYQDRYAEYRHIPSNVAADFRDLLDDWHFARIFGSTPVLNASFVECDAATRPFQVQDVITQKVWVMTNHSIQARRLVSKSADGRII